MPTTKLTGVGIKNLKPGEGGKRLNYFDTEHTGLCLRVGARDKAWTYHYRFDGTSRSPRLGKYAPGRRDHMDREAAIIAANAIEALVSQGIDPKPPKAQRGDKKQFRQLEDPKAKPTTANPNAFHRRVEAFLTWYETSPTRKGGKLRSKATVNQARRLLTDKGKFYYLEPLAHSDVGSIKRADILRLLEGVGDNPFQANRIHAYLEIFFNWCWDRGYCDPSPMAGLKKQYAEQSRDRRLTNAEIKRLWKGCLKLGFPWGDLCRFTLATGQRPGECQKLNRSDIYKDVWLVEGGDPKNRERHRIPLPKLAREILRKAPKREGPYVFTTTEGKVPVGQGGKPYTLLKKAAGFEDWQPRDLRRTFSTIASEELDIDTHLIGAICNQTSVSRPGVSGVYNRATWIKQKGKALEAWNDYLKGLIEGN